MSLFTNFLNLFKWDTQIDGEEEFDIDKALNDNWDKIDTKYNELSTKTSNNQTMLNNHIQDENNPHNVTKEQLGLENALLNNSNIKDTTVSFEQSVNRTNITTGETIATIAGKIAKYFTDLKNVAFTRQL